MGPASCSDPRHADLESRLSDLEKRLAAHSKDNAKLRARVAELEARLKKNSRNSSRPPSSDSPYKDRPSRSTPSDRKPGGQPGHEGKTRPLVPPQDVTETIPHPVDACGHCAGTDLEQIAVVVHQVSEIPAVAPQVIEHQVPHVKCRDCGQETVGKLPPEVAGSQFGTRAHAFAAQLLGGFRLTHREVKRAFDEMFGLEIGVGTLTAIQRRVTEALEFPYREAQRALREGPAAYIDETGWRVGRKKAYLWAACFGQLVVYLVDRRRDRGASRRLFGGKFHGVRIVDRYAVHDHVKDELRQICAAHVFRDFEGFVTGAAGGRMFGRRGKAIVLRVFRAWWRFQDGRIDRAGLQAACAKLERQLCALLDEAKTSRHAHVKGFAKKLRSQAACLFTFAKVEGIGPTNNAAERILRAAVLWRKGSFGSHSEQGARFVSRFMTVARSLRMQGRDVIEFVVEALRAHALGRAPPSLLPAPGVAAG